MRGQGEGGVEHDAGEAHAAGGGPEQVGVAVGADLDDVAAGQCGGAASVTCWHQLPLRWWFLPWMSAAMAPPTVTYRVPGVTGTNQPWGTRPRAGGVDAGARLGGDEHGVGGGSDSWM